MIRSIPNNVVATLAVCKWQNRMQGDHAHWRPSTWIFVNLLLEIVSQLQKICFRRVWCLILISPPNWPQASFPFSVPLCIGILGYLLYKDVSISWPPAASKEVQVRQVLLCVLPSLRGLSLPQHCCAVDNTGNPRFASLAFAVVYAAWKLLPHLPCQVLQYFGNPSSHLECLSVSLF